MNLSLAIICLLIAVVSLSYYLVYGAILKKNVVSLKELNSIHNKIATHAVTVIWLGFFGLLAWGVLEVLSHLLFNMGLVA
jgi:hypothetical protein